MGKHLFTVKQREIGVYIAILLYCGGLFFKRVNLPFEQFWLNKVMTLGALIAVANILLDSSMEVRQWIMSAVIGGLLLIDSLPTGNHELLYLFFIIWSCRNVEKDKMIRFIFALVLSMTIAVALLCSVGIIENELFVVEETRRRYSLGYSVWSILPFQYLGLCLIYLYNKQKKIWLGEVLLLNVIGAAIGMLTDTKSSILFTAVGTFALYLSRFIKIKRWQRLRWAIWLPEALTVVSMLAVYFYAKGNSFFARLNGILNNRLIYPAIGLERYGIGIWASPDFEMVADADAYFGIDNNYMNLLIAWGIVGLAVVLFMYSYLIKYCIENENLKLLIIVAFMAFTAFMWSRLIVLIEAEYIVCFSNVFAVNRQKKQKKQLNYGK